MILEKIKNGWDRYFGFSNRFISVGLVMAAAAILVASRASAIELKPAGPWKLGNVVVEVGWAKMLTDQPGSAAVYLTVKNNAGFPDLLFAAQSAAAKASVIQELENSKGTARNLPMGVNLAPQSELVMSPGKWRILFEGLDAAGLSNARLPIKLIFQEAGMIAIEVPVLPPSMDQPSRLHSKHS